MTPPSELLAQRLAAFGDTLYRLALLLAGDEAAATVLLRDLDLNPWRGRSAPQAGPPDETALLVALVAAARRYEERKARRAGRQTRSVRPNLFAPLPLEKLPLEQRLTLGLYLLLGYDRSRLAAVLGGTEVAAQTALLAGVRTLGSAAGHTLTERFSGEQCAGVRAALIDPGLTPHQGLEVRRHLAACASCRSFDQEWGLIIQAVEATLRTALRERTMPEALRAQLTDGGSGRTSHLAPLLRVALVPLAVLLLIALFVLPGFLRQPVRLVERDTQQPVDAGTLIARAIERQTTPPDQPGVWYRRYETAWFFDAAYAPLQAEVWIDSHTPARHRLQLTHRDGGAPYELQIGNGGVRLSYALDSAYASSLYGALVTDLVGRKPFLVEQSLGAIGQLRARDQRMQTGPWQIAWSYLHQAQSASDLRHLGRQREGERMVELLSFSGFSPLGLPRGAPDANTDRVTVLLAIDSEEGLLRSATELVGPAGAAQTSLVTWRLREERWLTSDEQMLAAFDPNLAWSGIGTFIGDDPLANEDVSLPVIMQWMVSDPATLLNSAGAEVWLPALLPVGTERALLCATRQAGQPDGLFYLGQGRRLVLAFNKALALDGEHVTVGVWQVTLHPWPGQRYTASLSRPPASDHPAFDLTTNLVIDAYGFTRSELVDVIASLKPFDNDSLLAQEKLFIKP